MKNFLINGFTILALAFLFTGCSDDDKVGTNPGPGAGAPGQASGFVFQSIKFNYDYVGSAPVLRGTESSDAEFREEIAGDIIAKRNLPESHDIAWECAGRDGSGKSPDIANIKIWFEKVCEPVAGYYNIHVWFVRMHVEYEIAHGRCEHSTFIEETYDFWENATALNNHPDNLIPNTGLRGHIDPNTNTRIDNTYFPHGDEIAFDPLNIDIRIINRDTLQGRVGSLILPVSQYDVQFFIQNQYRNGRGENYSQEQCEAGNTDRTDVKTYVKDREVHTPENRPECKTQPKNCEEPKIRHHKKYKSKQRSPVGQKKSSSRCDSTPTKTAECVDYSSAAVKSEKKVQRTASHLEHDDDILHRHITYSDGTDISIPAVPNSSGSTSTSTPALPKSRDSTSAGDSATRTFPAPDYYSPPPPPPRK